MKLGVEIKNFKITINRTVCNFSCKTSVFWRDGCSFRYLFSHFFVIFSWKISFFCEAVRSFWVKKEIFCQAKLQFLVIWVVFLSKKTTCALLHPPWSPGWKSSRPELRWWQQNQWKKKGLRRDGGAQAEGACERLWSAQAASEHAKRISRPWGVNSEAVYDPRHKPGCFSIKYYQSTDRPWYN